jgi:L-aminopeptidase/D-esterase-like protein
MLGMEHAMKTGIGSWAVTTPGGLKVGALVALNCVGDVIDPSSGNIIAGARRPDGRGFVDTVNRLELGHRPGTPFRENTVLGVVATNAEFDKARCTRIAQMAQDGIARAVSPSHTPWDGDTVFALATGQWKGGSADVAVVGAIAARVLATAIIRAVRQAESWGPYPSAKDFPANKR